MVPNESPGERPSSRPPLRTSVTVPASQPTRSAQGTAGPSPGDASDHNAHLSRFYFVVFMNGSAPLFHSNRIPMDLLNAYASQKAAAAAAAAASARPTAQAPSALSSSSSPRTISCADCDEDWRRCAGQHTPSRSQGDSVAPSPGSVRFVGDFAGNTVGMVEVPQQALQSIAFPSSFASARAGPRLTRRTPGATRLATPAPEMCADHCALLPDGFAGSNDVPRMGRSLSSDSLTSGGRDGKGGGASSTPTSSTASSSFPREPPFNLRLEEVRNTKGELRWCRVIATANFSALLSSHTGAMHAMQTRTAAIALVITCPATGQHYAFLQQHLKLVQALTYRVVHFGMRTTQRFFSLLLAGQGSGGAARGMQLIRNVTSLLEQHGEALDTYYELKRHLSAALALTLPLPPLCVLRYPTVRGSPEAAQVPSYCQQSFCTTLRVFPKCADKCARPSGSCGDVHFDTAGRTGDKNENLPTLSEYLFAALTRLEQFSDAFTSAVAAGVLSVGTPSGASQGLLTTDATATAMATPGGSTSRESPAALQCVPARARPLQVDPYETFWAQRVTQERRDLGKPPHPTFHATDAPVLDRRERSWRGLPAATSLATVSPTTSGHTSPISPLSNAPTTSVQTPWASAPPAAATTPSAVQGRVSPSPPAAVPANSDDGRGANSGVRPQTRTPATGAGDERCSADGFALGGARSGRVLIFTRDADLAWCLLLFTATLLQNEARRVFEGHVASSAEHANAAKWKRRLSLLAPRSCAETAASATWLASVQQSFATAFAGRTTSTAFVGVPIQWVPEEYSETRLLEEIREDPFSPYNALLVIAPRQLLCRRFSLKKTLDSTMVRLEQTSKGVEVRSTPQPFQCTVAQTETVLPDPLVDALLRECLQLHRLSRGAVPCAAVLHDMQHWLECQSANAVETERVSMSSSRTRTSLPSRYHSDTSLSHSASLPVSRAQQPPQTPSSPDAPQGRALSPSVPRSLCRSEWFPASVARTSAQEDENDGVLEELILPGSYTAATPSSTQPVPRRTSVLSTKGLVVPAGAMAGYINVAAQCGVVGGGSGAASPRRPVRSPGTSQLQGLLFVHDAYLSSSPGASGSP